MGCDIHTVAQVKTAQGNWETEADNIANERRSYDSFAVLADVRNGSGFAGIKTGEGWQPIDLPRGFPDDFEVEDHDHIWYWKEKRKWMGDHSHSWVTLKELKDKLAEYEDESYKVTGVLEIDQFHALCTTHEPPKSWCGGISGPNIVCIPQEEWSNLSDSDKDKVTHVRAEWLTPAMNRLKYLDHVKRHLELIRDWGYNEKSDEDVRLVFGFDS